MRIISGKYGGRKINALSGRDVRPTTDRVREAMFSTLNSLCNGFNDLCVLDAFGGSGALGLEALSRGASKCVTFECNRKAYQNLINNYESLNEDHKFVYNLDVMKVNFTSICKNVEFSLLLFDPPYKNSPNDMVNILYNIVNSYCILNDAIIVYEHSSKDNFDDCFALFEKLGIEYISSKTYGETKLEYLRYKMRNYE